MKQIFITGATSGIGVVAACELAAKGDKIIATARSVEKGNDLIAHYHRHYPSGKGAIEIVICDLSSFESVVKACNEIKANFNCLDVIINNAGVWNFSYRESKNNIEETFQVNVLAPLLISHLLLDLLSKSKEAKLIFAASALHQGNVDFSNLEYRNNFSGFKAYRQSKLEVVLLSRLLSKKLAKANICVYCEHPGLVNTKLGRDANWFSKLFFRLLGETPEKGAKTIIYLAEENKNSLVSGEYYSKEAIKKTTPQSKDMDVAQILSEKIQAYLANYLSSTSLIFEVENKI